MAEKKVSYELGLIFFVKYTHNHPMQFMPDEI